MAGQPKTRAAAQVIDSYGEENVFALYLRCGGVKKLLKKLGDETGHDLTEGTTGYYKWLRSEEGRWARWQEVKAMRGDLAVDEMQELADQTDEDNVQVNRVKIDVKKWVAEKLNRSEYGRESGNSLNVTINAQNAWLGALRDAEQVQAQPARHAVEVGSTRALTSGEQSETGAPAILQKPSARSAAESTRWTGDEPGDVDAEQTSDEG